MISHTHSEPVQTWVWCVRPETLHESVM